MSPLRNDVICTIRTPHSHLGMVVWGIEQCIPDPSVLTCITHTSHIWQCTMGLYVHGCSDREDPLKIRIVNTLRAVMQTVDLECATSKEVSEPAARTVSHCTAALVNCVFTQLSLTVTRYWCASLGLSSVYSGAYVVCTVNFAYNNTRPGIRKVSLFAKCRYMHTGRMDFALGMEILSLFANCRYIRCRY